MNPKHLIIICTELQLGSPNGIVSSIYGSRGGSFIWRVNTEKGSYAIKQLAPLMDVKSERVITKYELSETIAYQFAQQGIPAISAIKKASKHLNIIDNTAYLVYPWIEGQTSNQISETHALRIANIIAKLHTINLSVPEIEAPHVDMHTKESIREAFKIGSTNYLLAKTLKENQKIILSMYDNYLALAPLLLEDTVVSHGDLDQLNILWDKSDQPNLIDWESVRKLNPTRDIIRTSLNWSGMGTTNSSLSIYSDMLRTYVKAGGRFNIEHVDAALYSIVGSTVNWILYNIKLIGNSDVLSEKDRAIKEINSSVMSIKECKLLIPELLKISSSI